MLLKGNNNNLNCLYEEKYQLYISVGQKSYWERLKTTSQELSDQKYNYDLFELYIVRMVHRYFWGGWPLKGGPSTDRGSKIGVLLHVFGAENVFFAAPKAHEKILSTFFEVFGKFVNKNAIKSDFWGVVCRYISKISKKSPILGKKYFYSIRKISKVFLKWWGHLPPKYLWNGYKKSFCTFFSALNLHKSPKTIFLDQRKIDQFSRQFQRPHRRLFGPKKFQILAFKWLVIDKFFKNSKNFQKPSTRQSFPSFSMT